MNFNRICSACGEHSGNQKSHAKCSRIKQKEAADQNRKKAPRKLSKKQIDKLSHYWSKF